MVLILVFMNRIYDILLRWVPIFMLGILIIGGCAIITHDPYYELDDDTIIQSKLGIGEPQPISERPVVVHIIRTSMMDENCRSVIDILIHW